MSEAFPADYSHPIIGVLSLIVGYFLRSAHAGIGKRTGDLETVTAAHTTEIAVLRSTVDRLDKKFPSTPVMQAVRETSRHDGE